MDTSIKQDADSSQQCAGYAAEEGLEGLDCMAVINRDDCQAAESVEKLEAAVFEKQMQGMGYSGGDLAKIKDRCGVDKLVARLHTRFLQLVKTEWKTNTKASLEQKQRGTKAQLLGLGTRPQDLKLEQVLAYAACQPWVRADDTVHAWPQHSACHHAMQVLYVRAAVH